MIDEHRNRHTHLGVLQHAVLHGFAGAHLLAAHEQMHVLPVLGEVHRLLRGAVAAAHHPQLLVLEDGARTVADGARGDAARPKLVLGRDA